MRSLRTDVLSVDRVDLRGKLHTRWQCGHEGLSLHADRLAQDSRDHGVDGIAGQGVTVSAEPGLQHIELRAGVCVETCRGWTVLQCNA